MDITRIDAAAARLAGHVRRTPLLGAPALDALAGRRVLVKAEALQHTGSFKARGAFHSLISGDVPAAGIVAASGGNHGAAVAYAAAQLGIPARIFVPEIAGPTKIGLIRATGTEPDVVPGTYAEAFAASEAYRTETGAISIHAYDAPGTLTGQGTLGLELEAQAPDLDILLIAVGGGGLIGGVASWYREKLRIIAVEPENAPTLNRALANGAETEVDVSGIAANALGARRIGGLCHGIASDLGLESVLVTDDAIATAQRRLWSACRIAAEPGGATALAALTSGAFVPPDGAKIGVIVCGGNMDPAPLEM